MVYLNFFCRAQPCGARPWIFFKLLGSCAYGFAGEYFKGNEPAAKAVSVGLSLAAALAHKVFNPPVLKAVVAHDYQAAPCFEAGHAVGQKGFKYFHFTIDRDAYGLKNPRGQLGIAATAAEGFDD
jgi:hypothetical protein